jgi:hypothetical protein
VVTDGGRDFIFRCSLKLIPYGLDRFSGSLTDREKLYFPYEALSAWDEGRPCASFDGINEEHSHLSIGEYLRVYSVNDSAMLKEGILNFFGMLKAAGVHYSGRSYTCGSIALNHYIKKYGKVNLNLPKEVKENLRPAFYGGRCEIFGNAREGEKVLHFDFRGMYQQCMMEKLPYGNFRYANDNLSLDVPGFYYVVIESYSDFPVLPTKISKLMFPNGTVSGWYWHEEIKLALEFCSVRRLHVLHGYISESNDSVLADFMRELNGIREQGSVKKDIGKLLINSFFGRVGIDDEMSVMSISKSKSPSSQYAVFGDYFLQKSSLKKKPKANVALAAAVTAKARIRLYRALMEVIKHGGRPLYCDTDSVFAAFDKNLKIEDRLLGDYVTFDTAKRDTVIEDAVFILPKTYGLATGGGVEAIRIKGVNIRDISLKELKSKFYSRQSVLELSSSSISKANFELTRSIQKREIRLQSYDKRLWSDDLKGTTPICL